MSNTSLFKSHYWWVVASDKTTTKKPWHWVNFFEDYQDDEDFEFGGPDWIRSNVSFARIEKMHRDDIIVAYQAGLGIVGLAYLASNGYQADPNGPFDIFDLKRTPFVYLSNPVPYASVRDAPNASENIEFIAAKVKQGTVFSITEEGFQIILHEILQFNSHLDDELRSFLSQNNKIDEAKIIAVDNSSTLKSSHQVTTTFRRIIRNSVEGDALKGLYRFKCQICGSTIESKNGKRYAEIHHLRPLGNPHQGKDGKPNMLVLCPQHHAMFDLGIIALNPKSLSIEHWNNKASEHGKKLALNHELDKDCLEYQYEEIFKKTKT